MTHQEEINRTLDKIFRFACGFAVASILGNGLLDITAKPELEGQVIQVPNFTAGGTIQGPINLPDGTCATPTYGFTSGGGFTKAGSSIVSCLGGGVADTLTTTSLNLPAGVVYSIGGDSGISRTAPATWAVGNGTQGDVSGTLQVTNIQAGATGTFRSNGAWLLGQGSGNGLLALRDSTIAFGSTINVSALPTIASGFGTSPAITAGSTPFAGSVNVGTGASSSGIINFNGTAFPSAPFCIANDDSSILAVRPSASTTQLTLSAVAFTANDVISWVCVSSK